MTPYDPRKHLLSCRQRDQNWFGPPCTLHVVPPRNCTFGHFQTNRRRQSLRLFAKAARIFPDIRRLFRNGPNECKIGLFLPSHDLWYLNFWPPVHSIQVRSDQASFRQIWTRSLFNMANYPKQPVRNWCSNTLVWELEVGQDFVQFLWWKCRQMLAHIWVYAILSKKHWTEKYAWWRTFLLGLWPVRWQFHAVTAREESKILPVLFRMIFCKFPRLPVKQDVTCPLERHLYNLEI